MATMESIPPEVKPGDPITDVDENIMREALRQLYGASPHGGQIGSTGLQIKPQQHLSLPFFGRILDPNDADKQKHGWARCLPKRDSSVLGYLFRVDDDIVGGPNDEDAMFAIEGWGKRDIPSGVFETSLFPAMTDKGPIYIFFLPTFFDILVARDDAGGDAKLGSKTTQCTVTYTAKTIHDADADRITIGTVLTPLKRRPIKGLLDIESTTDDGTDFHPGMGKLGRDGFDIWDANETLGVQSCPDS